MAEYHYFAGQAGATEDEDVATRAQGLAVCLKQLAEECEGAGLFETANLVRTAALSALEEALPRTSRPH